MKYVDQKGMFCKKWLENFTRLSQLRDGLISTTESKRKHKIKCHPQESSSSTSNKNQALPSIEVAIKLTLLE